MMLENVLANENFDEMSTETLAKTIGTLGSQSSLTADGARRLKFAIQSFIGRILNNLKGLIQPLADRDRNSVKEFISQSPGTMDKVREMGYSRLSNVAIPRFMYRAAPGGFPETITRHLDTLRAKDAMGDVSDGLEDLAIAVKDGDSNDIGRIVSRLENCISPRNANSVTQAVKKMVIVRAGSNTGKFGDVFKNIREFEEMVQRYTAVNHDGTAYSTEPLEVAKLLKRVETTSEVIIDRLINADHNVSGKNILRLSKFFTNLDTTLQAFGLLVHELSASEKFVVDTMKAVQAA